MSQGSDVLNVAVTGDHVVFRSPDGLLLGSGRLDDVAAALAHAILGFPGSAASLSLPLASGTTLRLEGEAPEDRIPLTWTSGSGTTVATQSLPREAADALAEWLLASLSGTPSSEWPATRERLLDAIASARRARQQLEGEGASSTDISAAQSEEVRVRAQYADALPRVPIARDPFTSEVVAIPFDPAGLDGPFWDSGWPARPALPTAPTYVVTTGSMRVARSRIEEFGHLALPGPGVPYVVPRLLSRDGYKAVLVTVAVGPHLGQAVTYFTERPPAEPPLSDEWGRREHWLRDAEGRPTVMSSAGDEAAVRDFNLRPWIDAGKLAWVAPGDSDMRLRWAAAQCPFLTMRGEHADQRVQVGRIW